MDTLHIYYHYPELPKPLVRFIKCVELVNYCVAVVAFYLGLGTWFDSRSRGDQYYGAPPVSDPILPSSSATAKPRLSVVEYAHRRRRRGGEPTATCTVCLCDLEAGDEVRELGNCEHVFHKWCIDEWVERGKLTCPVCRSALLPAEERKEWKSTLLQFMGKLW